MTKKKILSLHDIKKGKKALERMIVLIEELEKIEQDISEYVKLPLARLFKEILQVWVECQEKNEDMSYQVHILKEKQGMILNPCEMTVEQALQTIVGTMQTLKRYSSGEELQNLYNTILEMTAHVFDQKIEKCQSN